MKKQETSLEGFNFIGIKTRTSNSEEMSGSGKIAALWNKFFSEQLLNQIPGRLDQNIIAIYCDYESDANAPYSLVIGAKVAIGSQPPPGMELLSIPSEKYFQITTRQGEMPEVIIEAWKEVWQLTGKSQLKRKYSYDLEVYSERAANPKAAEVDLFIAIE